jgi:hypothetical protein
MCTIAESKISEFVGLFKGVDGGFRPTMSVETALQKLWEQQLGSGFEHINIQQHVPGTTRPIIVSVRREPLKDVRNLLIHPDGDVKLHAQLCMDRFGQRVYNEMFTADKWLTQQVTSATWVSLLS